MAEAALTSSLLVGRASQKVHGRMRLQAPGLFVEFWGLQVNGVLQPSLSCHGHINLCALFPCSEWHLFNRFRGQDIRLLKTFSVGHICDLMVEKKKVKFGMK